VAATLTLNPAAMIDATELTALDAWMERQGLGAGPITQVTPLTGGTQNILLRFERAGRSFVLRRPPRHLRANSNETMRREARVLTAIGQSAVPHARLIAACADEHVIGAAFIVMEPIDGFNPTAGLPPLHEGSPDIRHRMGLALVEGIAALGALDYRELDLAGFGRPEHYLERQVERWRSQLASYADLPGWTGAGRIPGVDRVAAWLEAHRPGTFVPGIMHGDYHLANVMYRCDGPELAAIVDWELATIGDPLVDLGWLLATWPDEDGGGAAAVKTHPWHGFPTAYELIAHYRSRTSRDLTAIDWYAVLACYKLGILLEGTHARACAGRAPRDVGDQLHAKTIALFERALRWIG